MNCNIVSKCLKIKELGWRGFFGKMGIIGVLERVIVIDCKILNKNSYEFRW